MAEPDAPLLRIEDLGKDFVKLHTHAGRLRLVADILRRRQRRHVHGPGRCQLRAGSRRFACHHRRERRRQVDAPQADRRRRRPHPRARRAARQRRRAARAGLRLSSRILRTREHRSRCSAGRHRGRGKSRRSASRSSLLPTSENTYTIRSSTIRRGWSCASASPSPLRSHPTC